jgi:branched-chain amino acid transport system ATP-binding protein
MRGDMTAKGRFSTSPLVETRDLTIQFGGLTAVNEVSFEMGPGEVIGLIGPNGSGKTTFFNLITGIYRPTSGNILFRGERINGLPPFRITRRGIARTFQNNRLFWNLSVLDNVIIGMHHRQKSQWYDAIFRHRFSTKELGEAARMGLGLLRYFSQELADDCYKKANELPQAHRRRLEICRALAANPVLLLLDEPSAGMDPEETSNLMRDIRKIQEKESDIGIVVIEHDMTVIENIADRVVVFNYGRKIAEGSFAEVASNQEVLEAYLGEAEQNAEA